MAQMILLRLPTEEELDEFQIDFEGFYQEFIANSTGPFSAKVKLKNGAVDLAGYGIPKREWFKVIES